MGDWNDQELLDAGIGTALDAMRAVVEAGRLACGAGRVARRLHATPSTPDEGLPAFGHGPPGFS